MPETVVHRFFGGPPLVSIVRLLFVCLVVGAILMWLDIEPRDVFELARRTIDGIWSMGFDAIRQVGRYIVAGAVIVVPIWLVTRLLGLRGVR